MARLNKKDFYAWAYDDLFTNTTRGVLAEYIVATALGVDDTKRREWANHDLVWWRCCTISRPNSNSARLASTPATIRPAAVEVSMPSRSDRPGLF